MSASMAEGIAAHLPVYRFSHKLQANTWMCSTPACEVEGEFTEVVQHVAEQLAANGYGKLEEAWDEGYELGVEDERTSEANIGIAGDLCNQTPCQCKVQPARVNPHRRPE